MPYPHERIIARKFTSLIKKMNKSTRKYHIHFYHFLITRKHHKSIKNTSRNIQEFFARKLDKQRVHIARKQGVNSKKKAKTKETAEKEAQAQNLMAWKHRERWIDPRGKTLDPTLKIEGIGPVLNRSGLVVYKSMLAPVFLFFFVLSLSSLNLVREALTSLFNFLENQKMIFIFSGELHCSGVVVCRPNRAVPPHRR